MYRGVKILYLNENYNSVNCQLTISIGYLLTFLSIYCVYVIEKIQKRSRG